MAVDRSRLPAVGGDPGFRFPAIVRHALANGLRVRTVEHRSMPIVTFTLLIEGGAGADASGAEGLAALVADMADEGTGNLSAIDVSDSLARIGATYDVDVGPDSFGFTLTTLERFAQRGASLLAEMVTKPRLAGSDFDRIRKLRIDRLRQLKDSPSAVAERTFLRLLYGEHPYGHIPIGNEQALSRFALDDVVSFHRSTFRPSRATIVAAGSMTHEELLRSVDEAFGQWRDGGGDTGILHPIAAEIEPQTAARGLAIVPRERAAQSELRIGHLSARRDTPDYAALIVMNAVLGGQFVSRINLKLREEKGYTYGARSGFDWRRGPGPFAVQASVHTAATADSIRDSLDELYAIQGSRPVSEAELALAKASLTRGYPRSFETVQQVAHLVAQLALYGLPDTYFAEFVPKVNTVSQADVTRVANQHLHPDQLITLVVGDHASIAESLHSLDLGVPQVLPIS